MENHDSVTCSEYLSAKNGFYFSHMEYEGSIGLVTRKMDFFFADFNFLGLFMEK
jgi:hypothetical protein